MFAVIRMADGERSLIDGIFLGVSNTDDPKSEIPLIMNHKYGEKPMQVKERVIITGIKGARKFEVRFHDGVQMFISYVPVFDVPKEG